MYKGNLTSIRSFVFDVMNLLNVVRYLSCKHVTSLWLGPEASLWFHQVRSWEAHNGVRLAVLRNLADKDKHQGKIIHIIANANLRILFSK